MTIGRISLPDLVLRRAAEVALSEAATFHAVRDQVDSVEVRAWADFEMRRAHDELARLRPRPRRPYQLEEGEEDSHGDRGGSVVRSLPARDEGVRMRAA